LWYVYRCEDKPVVATSGSDIDIHVYTDCGYECFWIYMGSRRVTWIANVGIYYIILVSERIYSVGDQTFDLSIMTNDAVENAFGPISPGGSNTVVKGSTSSATADNEVPVCGRAQAPTAPGVW
jgi:hypothetical protein